MWENTERGKGERKKQKNKKHQLGVYCNNPDKRGLQLAFEC